MLTDRRDFLAALPPRGSLLALDLSKRRIGLAGTDVERRLATPLLTFERAGRAKDLERLRRVVA
jgi:putative holliday junction resolvase